MKLIILSVSILFTIHKAVQGFPLQDEPIQELPYNDNPHLFVLTPLIDESNIPDNAFVVKAHINEESSDDLATGESSDPIRSGRENHQRMLAIPLSEAKHDTEILHHKGVPVIAKHTDSSDEDLVTAENIVFRPLFAYRNKMTQRRRVYAPTPTANRRYYTPAPQPRPTYYPYNYPSYGYPHYYPSKYRRTQEVDRFPTLA